MTNWDLSSIEVASTVDARGSACPGPLLEAKKGIGKVKVGEICQTYFEIVPLEIDDSGNSVRAFIFLCRYGGTVDADAYGFRKCYARACSDHQCANMYQAVMTAKPYAYADYNEFDNASIKCKKQFF